MTVGPGEHLPTGAVSARKLEHVELALAPEGPPATPAGWDDVRLVPRALPELSPGDVDLTTELAGHTLAAPIVLAPMTGGHPELGHLNAVLGEAAAHLGIAVGVGSQRAALADPSLAGSFAAVRDRAPDVVVLANLGACQLIAQASTPALTADDVQAAIEMVGADALTVHLNVAQELVQTEGDRTTGPFLPALERVVSSCPVPVLVKETGSGMTGDDARRLAEVGVAAVDVGGAGGTSFVDIEGARARRGGDDRGARLGATFRGWGVPTAASVLETRSAGVPVVATGGIRHGLDVARAVALGARAAGLGRVAMAAAHLGVDALVEELEAVVDELRTALVLCGAPTPGALVATPPVLTGDTLEWARQRRLLPTEPSGHPMG